MATKTPPPVKRPSKLEALVKHAQKLSGLKKQEVLNQAMLIYVEHLKKQTGNGQPSFYDLTKHLAGSVQGPPDLARNKKHMEGFGQ